MKIKFLKSLPYYMLLRCSMQYVVRKINPKFFKPLFLPILLTTFYILLSSTTHAGTIIKSPAYLGLNAGLVGCWSFDGSYTNAPDCSWNNNVGTLTGGPTKTVGKVGQDLSFDGVDDWVNMGSFVPVSGGNPRTVSVWVKVTSSATNRTITSWGSDSVAGQRFTFSINTSNTLSIGIEGSAESAVTAVGDNIWHHVAITCSGNNLNTCKIWVDGRLDKTLTTSATINTSSSDRGLSIGIWPLPFGPFNGQIDEVRIYNRALTSSEVERLYKGSKASVVNKTKTNRLTNGLVGYWTFDGKDIYSTTAIDRSGSGNNGTLTNGPVPTIGKIGQALNFDGSDDYVSLSDFADSSANITISAWVRPRTFDNVWPFISTIVGKELAGNNSYTLRAGDSAIANNRLQWAIIQSNSTAVKLDANITVGLLSTSTSSHVTATYNTSGRQEIYINGVLNASQSTADGTLKDSTAAIEIGRSFAASARIWDGQIDDVRIYNRALSAEEIYQLYNMGR